MDELNNFENKNLNGPDPIKNEKPESFKPIAPKKTNGADPVFKAAAIIFSIFIVILCVSTIFDIVSKTQGEGEVVTNDERGSLMVNGSGEVSVVPDVAQVSVGIETETDSIQEAVSENSRKINNIVNYAQGLGIASEDIKTIEFSVEPQYQKSGDQISVGNYKVNQTVQITIRNIDLTGEVLQSSLDAGANTVSDLTFVIDDSESYIAEARQMAIENAEIKAQEIASQLGVELGDIESYSESSYGVMRAAGGGESISIDAGTSEVSVSVYLTYSLK